MAWSDFTEPTINNVLDKDKTIRSSAGERLQDALTEAITFVEEVIRPMVIQKYENRGLTVDVGDELDKVLSGAYQSIRELMVFRALMIYYRQTQSMDDNRYDIWEREYNKVSTNNIHTYIDLDDDGTVDNDERTNFYDEQDRTLI